MNMTPYVLLFIGCICSLFTGFSQETANMNDPFEDFTKIYSEGKLPIDYTNKTSLKLKQEIASFLPDSLKENEDAIEFLKKTHYSMDRTFRTGNILVGDTLTRYINKIADRVLEKQLELRKQVRLYVQKSPTVNAFATHQGVLLINLGLLAKMNSEADLAFIIAHEIAHYKQKHSFNSHMDAGKLIENNKQLSYDEKLDSILYRSRKDELEADSVGIELLKDSGYELDQVSESLKLLHYSYLSIEEQAFIPSFFNKDDFQIPNCFYLSNVKEISAIEIPNSDIKHTHPNILKRIEKSDKIIDGAEKKEKRV